MVTLASSVKTLFTIIFSVFLGSSLVRFFVVIQNNARVWFAKFLYFLESKKVRSFLLALFNGFTSLILMFLLNFIFGNNLDI